MLHLHAFFIIARRPRIHTQHDVLNFGVGLVEIMRVVRCDQRQTCAVRKVHGQFHAVLLDLKPRVLDLHVKAIAKHPRVPFDESLCIVVVLCQQQT